ncbi:MAG: Coenzyme F420 hydrogenase/dehydrogenase, beta subunit C-terminal domain [Candidatus Thorarchaeota archaeon]
MSFELLKSEIIDKDLCEGCGLCAGFCKVITMEDGVPELTGRCVLTKGSKHCGLCFELCPQAHPEVVTNDSFEPLLTASLRSTDSKILETASNGGFVTSFLKDLLKKKKVDAVVAVTGEKYIPLAISVTMPGDISKTTGTRYSPSGVMNELATTLRDVGTNIAVVGLPCELRGVNRLEKRLGKTFLKIGLFCSNNTRKTEDGKTEKLGSCAFCTDFVGVHADLSCGFSGSATGFTSVIALTEKGSTFLEAEMKSKGYEKKEVDLTKIRAAQTRKNKREPTVVDTILREKILVELLTNGPDEINELAQRLGLVANDIIYDLLVLQLNESVRSTHDHTKPYEVVWSIS